MEQDTAQKNEHRATQYETYKQISGDKTVFFLVLNVEHDTTAQPWTLKGYHLLKLFHDQEIKFVAADDFSKLVEKKIIQSWVM
jgi:hypothetical protein